MSTSFPGTLDTFINPAAGSTTTAPSHAGQHTNINDAVGAVQAKIGVGSGTPTTGSLLRSPGAGTSTWLPIGSSGQILTSNGTTPAWTSPVGGTSLLDANGSVVVGASSGGVAAVNAITATNAVAGATPVIAATGSDANIHLNIKGKGSALVGIPTLQSNNGTTTYQTGDVMLTGWGYVQGNASGAVAGTVTHGLTFTETPRFCVVNVYGFKSSTPTDPSSGITSMLAYGGQVISAGFPSTTTLQVILNSTTSMGTGSFFVYDYMILGQLL